MDPVLQQTGSEAAAGGANETPVTPPVAVGAIDTVAEWNKRRSEVADRRDGDGIEAAPAEKPETPVKPETPASEPDPASDAGKELAKKRGSLQSRIDEITREKGEIERRSAAEIARLQAELEAAKRPQQPAQPAAQPGQQPAQSTETPAAAWERFKTLPGAPDVNSFKNYEDYVLAVGVFVAQETAKEIGERQALEGRQRAAAEAMSRTHAAAVAEYPDFDAVMESFVGAGGRFAPAVQHRILSDAQHGHKLAYALAKDPGLNARLSGIADPVQFGIELGGVLAGLTAKPAAPAPKPVSQAPPPIPSIQGEAPAASPDPSKISSVAEWNKQRGRFAHAIS